MSSSISKTPTPPCHLLRLPKEIRLQLWEIILPNDLDINLVSLRFRVRVEQACFLDLRFFQTCRAVYEEAACVLYGGNVFHIATDVRHDQNRARLCWSLNRIGDGNVARLNRVHMHKYEYHAHLRTPKRRTLGNTAEINTAFSLRDCVVEKTMLFKGFAHQETADYVHCQAVREFLQKLRASHKDGGAVVRIADVLALHDTFMRGKSMPMGDLTAMAGNARRRASLRSHRAGRGRRKSKRSSR